MQKMKPLQLSIQKAIGLPVRRSRRKKKRANEVTPLHPILQLQQTIGNQAVNQLIQTKLTIGRSGDKYEQEADRVADIVMNMPEPQIQRQAEEEEKEEQIQTKPIADQITPLVQRQVEEEEEEELRSQPIEEEEEKEEELQRQPEEEKEEMRRQSEEEEEEKIQPKTTSEKTQILSSRIESNIRTLRGSGQPLPESTRSFFEPQFGYDFSQVRVHTDTWARDSARAVNARAFTIGQNVIFDEGQYAPETNEGRRLLAHELTHVIQQEVAKFKRTLDEKTVYRNNIPVRLQRSPGTMISFRVKDFKDEFRSGAPKVELDPKAEMIKIGSFGSPYEFKLSSTINVMGNNPQECKKYKYGMFQNIKSDNITADYPCTKSIQSLKKSAFDPTPGQKGLFTTSGSVMHCPAIYPIWMTDSPSHRIIAFDLNSPLFSFNPVISKYSRKASFTAFAAVVKDGIKSLNILHHINWHLKYDLSFKWKKSGNTFVPVITRQAEAKIDSQGKGPDTGKVLTSGKPKIDKPKIINKCK